MRARTSLGLCLSLFGLAVLGLLVPVPRQEAGGTELLAVFVAPQHSDDQITLRLIIPYEALQPGLAHYVEHLTVLSANGGRLPDQTVDDNASTTPLSIIYYLSGSRGELKRMLRTLARVFDPINVDPAVAKTERNIILREYDLRLLQNADAKADEAMNAFLYAGTASAISTIGSPEQISDLSYSQAVTFHDGTHLPKRAILLASGSVSDEELQSALTETRFPDMASRASLHPVTIKLKDPEERSFAFADTGSSPHLVWRKVVKLPNPFDYELLYNQCDVLDDLLVTALPGGLAKPLRYDHFIARNFDVGVYPLDEQHVQLSFTAEPDHGVSLDALRTAFETELGNALNGIPRSTFERVQRRFLDATPSQDDRVRSENWVAFHVLNRLLATRLPPTEDQLRKLDSEVTAEGVDRLAAALNEPGRVAFAFITREQAK